MVFSIHSHACFLRVALSTYSECRRRPTRCTLRPPSVPLPMIRLGLCCGFHRNPNIKFRQATIKYVRTLDDPSPYLSNLVLQNCEALEKSIEECRMSGIGCFRVTSQFCPLITVEDLGYGLGDLPHGELILRNLKRCRELKDEYGIRLAMHPGPFVVLSSPNDNVVKKSIAELEYHQMLAELIGVDVINIHLGGVYGNKAEAMKRFARNFDRLSLGLQTRLTLENDDIPGKYTPKDLTGLCKDLGIPLVYDVHHHRLNSDGDSIETATENAIRTWNREPLFHISSPHRGWDGPRPLCHHDIIDPNDFPEFWLDMEGVTIEVEAKAKEVAVGQLRKYLRDEKGVKLWQPPAEFPRNRVRLPDYVAGLVGMEVSKSG